MLQEDIREDTVSVSNVLAEGRFQSKLIFVGCCPQIGGKWRTVG